MIIVEGHVRMENAYDFDKVRGAAESQIAASCAEDGCIDYTYAIDVLDPHIMRVLERWRSWEDLEAHFKAAHMEAWRQALSGVKFVEREIRAHEVSETRGL
ncbi:MAG: antibiotic biosynthesis monooxygenase [Pseudomonadota bacterium]